MKKITFLFILVLGLGATLWAQDSFSGRWVGTYGSGTNEGSSYYSFMFNADGSFQLYNNANQVIASGSYQANGNQFSATYTYNGGGSYSVSGLLESATVMRGSWGSGTSTSGGGRWVMSRSGSMSVNMNATPASSASTLTGRWTGTYGSGSQEGPNYYSFMFNADGSFQLYNNGGQVIASGTYTGSPSQFSATYSYSSGGTYSVAGAVDASGVLRGTWGSNTNTSGGGRWVMTGKPASTPLSNNANLITKASTPGTPNVRSISNTGRPAKNLNNVIPSNTNTAGTYLNTVKEIRLNDGRKISVQMNRNPSLGQDFVMNKNTTQQLPSEQKDGWTTEVKKVRITAESKSFMNASQNNSINIVPGAIYRFEDFVGGSLNEITGNRNPIRIYTDNTLKPGATGGVTINAPAAYEIYQGNGGQNIGAIRNSIYESSGGSNIIFQSFSSNSEAELTLKVTAGGSYGGFSANGSYNLAQNKNRVYLTIDAVKKMFTIKAEKPTNGFFASPDNTPNKVYVKEVDYGTRILANVEIILEDRKDIVNFKANYEGTFKADAGTEFINKTKIKNETVNAYIIGGPMNLTTISKDKLEEEIRTLLASCTFQHAQPISYRLGDMDGNTISTVSATDEITERISTPDNLQYRLSQVQVEIQTGEDNKDAKSQVSLGLYSGNGRILFEQGAPNTASEFAANQPVSVGLVKHPHCVEDDLLMNNISQAGGLRLRFYFWPTQIVLGRDAWSIGEVKLKLFFVDQNGTPHPNPLMNGSRPITLKNTTGMLHDNPRVLECYLDGKFTPTTSTYRAN